MLRIWVIKVTLVDCYLWLQVCRPIDISPTLVPVAWIIFKSYQGKSGVYEVLGVIKKQSSKVTVSVGVAWLSDEFEVGVIGLVNMHIGKIVDLKLLIISNRLLEEGPRGVNRPKIYAFSSNIIVWLIMIYCLTGTNSQ